MCVTASVLVHAPLRAHWPDLACQSWRFKPISCGQFPWLHLSRRAQTWERGERSWDNYCGGGCCKKEEPRMMGAQECEPWAKTSGKTNACCFVLLSAAAITRSGLQVVMTPYSPSYLCRGKRFCAENQHCRASTPLSLEYFCFEWDPRCESIGISSTIWFPWWQQGVICPLQTEGGKQQLEALLFSVWVII